MRAWEFIIEHEAKRPEISLRTLNALKRELRAREASEAWRKALVPIMYANPAKENEQIELEKARLELEQEKAELAATRAEAQVETREAISDMAKAGAEVNQKNRAKITNMAQAELGRRKK